jgi:hypothetical protein
MSFEVEAAFFAQTERFVKTQASFKTEQVSHAPDGLRGSGI